MNDMHSLTGAYAAGALDAAENEMFVAHLADCAPCALEVRELLETTALLGVAAARPAPAGLRSAVLAEVARTRQAAPVVSLTAGHAERPGRPQRRWTLSAAACLAAFTVGLGGYALHLHNENDDLRHAVVHEAAPAPAPDAWSVTGRGWTAQVTAAGNNQLQFVCQGLNKLPSGRTYQIWLIGPSGPHSAGTFTSTQNQPATRTFTGPGDATTLAVTEEPSGGSAKPTTQPFLIMPIRQA